MSAAIAPNRYLFDLDFDVEARQATEEEEVPTISLYEHEALIKKVEREAYGKGLAEGRKAAVDEGANRLAEQTGEVATAARALIDRLDGEIAAREERAVRLAIIAAKKLARRVLADHPNDEIFALFQTCLAPLFDASHLVVRLSADHVEAVRGGLEAAARERGFEGRLVLMGEDTIAPGDCRIEWADGGLVRDSGELEAAIDALINDYLAARSIAAGALSDMSFTASREDQDNG